MKIRLDFVSNSSSSSFMVVGAALDEDQLVNLAKSYGYAPSAESNADEEEDCEADSYEATEWIEDHTELTIERGAEDYYDCWCVGLPYRKMQPDETRAQFEARIAELLKPVLGDGGKVEELIDGGYNG